MNVVIKLSFSRSGEKNTAVQIKENCVTYLKLILFNNEDKKLQPLNLLQEIGKKLLISSKPKRNYTICL